MQCCRQDKNAEEWKDILNIAEKQSIDVRFIEMMPIGKGRECDGISNDDLLREIQKQYPGVCKDDSVHGNGPAVYYHIPGFIGSVGFISAIHGVFCSNCNRIRMTATGELKPCLCYQRYHICERCSQVWNGFRIFGRKLQEAIQMKPKQHCFDMKEDITEQHKMVQIGG